MQVPEIELLVGYSAQSIRSAGLDECINRSEISGVVCPFTETNFVETREHEFVVLYSFFAFFICLHFCYRQGTLQQPFLANI